jgi:hypothetical protein
MEITLEATTGGSHNHYRFIAKRANELVVGDTLLKNGTPLRVESVVWTFQLGNQQLWTSLGVRNLLNGTSYLLPLAITEWALQDTWQSLECGC